MASQVYQTHFTPGKNINTQQQQNPNNLHVPELINVWGLFLSNPIVTGLPILSDGSEFPIYHPGVSHNMALDKTGMAMGK